MRFTIFAVATASILQLAIGGAFANERQSGYLPWRLPLPRVAEPSSDSLARPSGLRVSSARPSNHIASMTSVHNDVDGDGRSDLIWYTYFSDHTIPTYWNLSYWRMEGPSRASTHNHIFQSDLRAAPTSGDFNGDGRTDLLYGPPVYHPINRFWFSRGDGGFDTAQASGGDQYIGWALTYLPNNVDLNADGRDDILLRKANDNLGAYLLMDGRTVLGSVIFDLGPGYAINGAGDFDGDGLGDLLCSLTALGHLYFWHNRGDGGFDVSLIAVYDPSWEIVGNPDLNGDGRSDIVWSNQALNMLGFWWLDGASIIRSDSKWAGPRPRVATGDFDGDGIGDVVWTQQVSPYYSFMWRSRGDGEFDAYLIAQINQYWRSAL